jgi:signal transduction histidine kinase
MSEFGPELVEGDGAATRSTDIGTARLSPSELRTLFLFERLDDDQLSWLSDHGYCQTFAGGEPVYAEGDPATCFYVLLSGTMSMHRRVENTEVETGRTNQRGVYSGATQSFVKGMAELPYWGSARAVTECDFWVIGAEELGEKFREWFPMATHLIEGITMGFRSSQAIIGQRERLLSLGRLSAGLTHELNNPAAAAVRATASLRELVSKIRRKLVHLATADVDPKALMELTELQEEAVEKNAKAEKLSPVQVGELEDELSDWLDDHGIDDAWDLAPTLAAAGVDSAWLDEVAHTVPDTLLSDGVHWVTYALDVEQLMGEIEDSTGRISALVAAAKQYSQMDRAAHQDIDVRDGLKSTLVMLSHKINKSGNIKIVKDFDESLPMIPAHPAELNQVWTNLIDNAVYAMLDGGTLTVRTAKEDGWALVEICDTGVGIPPEMQQKIFEPFFTTKPVGQGTGLGLDISYRVITQRHGGDLRVRSVPGDTRFQVRLPLTEPPSFG